VVVRITFQMMGASVSDAQYPWHISTSTAAVIVTADQESSRQPKLLERVRQAIWPRHYSRETEKA